MPIMGLIALDDAQLTGLASLMDGFDLANRYTKRLYERMETTSAPAIVKVLTPRGRPCRLANGREFPADLAYAAAPHLDLIYVAPVLVADDGVDAWLDDNAELCSWIAKRHANGTVVAASGSATLLLAAAGLLDGAPATTPWWLEKEFRKRFPKPQLDIARVITEHDRVYCAGTARGEPALALQLLERTLSQNVSSWVAKVTTVDPHPDGPEPWTIFSPQVLRQDGMVGRAQHWLQQHFSQKLSIAKLADAMSVSERTLTRRFQRSLGMTPLTYLQTLRVEAAKQMLARSSRRTDRIAYLVGYADVGFFTKVFRERTGLSPREFREQTASEDVTPSDPEPDPDSDDA